MSNEDHMLNNTSEQYEVMTALNMLTDLCHSRNVKWWQDPATGKPITRNAGELIALMHSELSEALEGVRKNKQDDHVPEFLSEEVELADLLIRAFDYAGGRKLRLAEAFHAKMLYNASRQDHTHEARLKADGKRF